MRNFKAFLEESRTEQGRYFVFRTLSFVFFNSSSAHPPHELVQFLHFRRGSVKYLIRR